VKSSNELNMKVDCIIIAVAHEEFKRMKLDDVKKFMNSKPVLIDVRGMFKEEDARKKGFYYRGL